MNEDPMNEDPERKHSMGKHEKHLEDLIASAVSGDETTLVALDALACVECRAIAPGFSETLSVLASEVADAPSYGLRNRILEKAFDSRTPIATSPPPSTPTDAYVASVASLNDLLTNVSLDSWMFTATENWNVQELVEHLRVVDSIATDALTSDNSDGSNTSFNALPEEIEDLTRKAITQLDTENPSKTKRSWHDQADRLVTAARVLSANGQTVQFLGVPLPSEAVIADRAFETWLHTQDIRRAFGLPFQAPATPDLRVLTDLGARMLPIALEQQNHGQQGSVRLVLTGEGGGNWVVPLRSSDVMTEPRATLTLDPIDFCLIIGDRLNTSDVRFTVDGDYQLAQLVLTTAPSLSRI